ncbi:MAG: diaminopimelate epimerase [Chthonomonadales bacterium]
MSDASRKIPFTKMQGVGNDFILVEADNVGEVDWSEFAIRTCDRKFGPGADGLLVLDHCDRADAFMRMYNPDGSPDVCGNGLRCISRYMWDHKGFGESGKPVDLTIETFGGVVDASMKPQVTGVPLITVNMGPPKFDPADIPMAVDVDRVIDYPIEIDERVFELTTLSTGSAHSVIFVDELPTDQAFLRWSPLLERHPLFPERTSIMWARVIEHGTIELRIWERGVGETWGCGTGACAAGIAAILKGFADERVTVRSRGGELVICWREGEGVLMTGPAEYVYDGFLY